MFNCLHAMMSNISSGPICLTGFMPWYPPYQQAQYVFCLYAVMSFTSSTGLIHSPVFMQWCTCQQTPYVYQSSYSDVIHHINRPHFFYLSMQWCCSSSQLAPYVYLSSCSDVVHHINRPHFFTCLCSDVVHRLNWLHMFTCLHAVMSFIISTGPICFICLHAMMLFTIWTGPICLPVFMQWCHSSY